jgi:hypothetical protein
MLLVFKHHGTYLLRFLHFALLVLSIMLLNIRMSSQGHLKADFSQMVHTIHLNNFIFELFPGGVEA